MRDALAASMKSFVLPKYDQLPSMGLYLEQTTKYLNQCLAPLQYFEITSSMIRNYVKMGLVKNPVKKQYYGDHIAHLIVITILKPAMSLEDIRRLFKLAKEVYPDEKSYNYFCTELTNTLDYRMGLSSELNSIGDSETLEKEMLRTAITAVSHIIYLNYCFRAIEHTVLHSSETKN